MSKYWLYPVQCFFQLLYLWIFVLDNVLIASTFSLEIHPIRLLQSFWECFPLGVLFVRPISGSWETSTFTLLFMEMQLTPISTLAISALLFRGNCSHPSDCQIFWVPVSHKTAYSKLQLSGWFTNAIFLSFRCDKCLLSLCYCTVRLKSEGETRVSELVLGIITCHPEVMFTDYSAESPRK